MLIQSNRDISYFSRERDPSIICCSLTTDSSSAAYTHPSSITLPPLLALLTSTLTLPLHLHTSPPHSEIPSYPQNTSSSSHCPLLLLLPSVFPLPPSSLISLVNNSTALHTWVVIMKLHMGDLEDKWTIRMEELKTSPRLHYRAKGICCLPGLTRLCIFFLSSPTTKC